MSRRGSYIADIGDSLTMTSFSKGPVHNAVRRMTELIDLENLEGYFDEYLKESQQQQQKTNHQESDFDTLSQVASEPRSPIPFITIESYTKIRIERQDESDEIPQARVTPLNDQSISSNEHCEKSSPKRSKRINTAARISHLEKNAWPKTERNAHDQNNHYDKKNKSKKSIVFKFFFGINDEFKWYSLKGKGLCIILPMSVAYIILCAAILPCLVAAAVVGVFILCGSVCAYLSLATKKVGVSSDDDGDKSCLEAVMWWA